MLRFPPAHFANGKAVLVESSSSDSATISSVVTLTNLCKASLNGTSIARLVLFMARPHGGGSQQRVVVAVPKRARRGTREKPFWIVIIDLSSSSSSLWRRSAAGRGFSEQAFGYGETLSATHPNRREMLSTSTNSMRRNSAAWSRTERTAPGMPFAVIHE